MSGWACRTIYNVNPFVGLSRHDTMLPSPLPPFMVPLPSAHVEFSVVQGLWLGSFLSNGRKRKIVGDDLLFVGRTSDAGLIVPHVSVPIPSWMNVLTTLFGSSMTIFGASSVSLACKNLLWGNQDCDIGASPFGPVPLSLNLGCFEPISLPTDFVVVWGSVYVGVTWGDMLAALIEIGIAIAADLVGAGVGKIGSHVGGKLLKRVFGGGSTAFKSVVKQAVDEAVDQAVKETTDAAVQRGAKAAAEAAAKAAARAAAEEAVEKAAKQGVELSVKEAGKEAASAATEEAIQKAAREAAEEAVAKGTKKNAVQEAWSSFSETVLRKGREAAGQAATDEYVAYMTKGLELQGMMRKLDMDDAAIAAFARNLDLSQGMDDVLRNLDEGMDGFLMKYGKNLDDATGVQDAGSALLKEASDYGYTSDAVLTLALKELDFAVQQTAKGELVFELALRAFKKTCTRIVWGEIIKKGDAFGQGTEGGLLSLPGENVDFWGLYEVDLAGNKRFSEKWYANLNDKAPWLPGDDDTYQWEELGLTYGDDAAETVDEGQLDESVVDYWYELASASSNALDEAMGNDYWWDDASEPSTTTSET